MYKRGGGEVAVNLQQCSPPPLSLGRFYQKPHALHDKKPEEKGFLGLKRNSRKVRKLRKVKIVKGHVNNTPARRELTQTPSNMSKDTIGKIVKIGQSVLKV